MENIKWTGSELILLDQTKLPTAIEYLHCTDWRQVAEAIKQLRVRGAPAIGVAAAYAVVLAVQEIIKSKSDTPYNLLTEFCDDLKATRPTAINLAWAVNRMLRLVNSYPKDTTFFLHNLLPVLEQESIQIHQEDMNLNFTMAKEGLTLFKGKNKLKILTHCNAGALATSAYGTALGVVRELFKNNQLERVYADETRPLLQGARLTAFELAEDGIPVTLLTDNMAGYAMQQGLIDAVIVGADRITTEGDVANKIGTYSVAMLAKAHNIPFYVAAPYSTFDFSLVQGKDIPIEMRNPEEVRNFYGVQTAPNNIDILNPAFDVTPHQLVTAIITERGVLQGDLKKAISNLKREIFE